VPIAEYSDGDDANKILQIGKIKADPWQKNIINDWFSRDKEGQWAASICGLSVPRQNGKTLTTVGRIAAGMVLFNEWVVYTAHLQKTSSETFRELRDFFETSKLCKYVKAVKGAVGREQIFLKNGAIISFLARTRNGGRGLHCDLLIFDEAQELTEDQQAAFLPALSASANPQTIYLGTPPDEQCDGFIFRGIRDKAKQEKTGDIAWSEFSVNEIGDVEDRERWYATNPSLGYRMLEKTVASECSQMAKDKFARERLGWWSPPIAKKEDVKAFNKKAWEDCQSLENKPDGKTSYGVKFSLDGSEVCLAGAVIESDGRARISVIERKSTAESTRWLSDWLNIRYSKASCVVIDGKNGVDLLIDRIVETWRAKGSIKRAGYKEVISAATLLIDAVNEKKITWYKYQEDLNDSAINAIKRPIAGGYGLGGDNPLPIEACALALWGVKTSKRDPSKVMRIG
jgi:hypothetical protein